MELNLSKDTLMLDLTKAAPSLTRLRGALNWNLHPMANKGHEFDLDIFMFLTEGGSIKGDMKNVCFFNNKDCYNGAVVLPRDNRNGADVDGEDDEEIFVEIGKVPAHIDKIEHFVFLHDAIARKQDFSMIAGGSFDLYDQDNNLLAEYKLQQFVNGTALHVGTLQRVAGGWGFQPVGESAQANPNEVLQAFK
ncbi:General stress protein 16U [Pseudomonas phage VCM]|uniref:General stress protein 16U n=1 Tax=Pseudomonas phage VCM TaxID=1729937 RepID=A0A0S4KZ16_9CAUD|nr:General stress protein 16U [Pseudomonas phage VCM]CUR44375.1 General stress protein 16U [Pseudomonas phage VCM]